MMELLSLRYAAGLACLHVWLIRLLFSCSMTKLKSSITPFIFQFVASEGNSPTLSFRLRLLAGEADNTAAYVTGPNILAGIG